MSDWHERKRLSQRERRQREVDLVQTALLLAMRKLEMVKLGEGAKFGAYKAIERGLAEVKDLRRFIDEHE